MHRMADIKPKFQLRMVGKTDCQAYTGEPNEDGTITICQEETKTYHKDDDFIFLDKTGKRIHDHAINNVIRRLNGVRNEKMLLSLMADHPAIIVSDVPRYRSFMKLW